MPTKKHAARRARPLTLESLETRALLTTLMVVDSGNDGPGTFRAAIEEANLDSSVDKIRFAKGLDPIVLESSVAYTSGQDLRIAGRGATITSDVEGDFDLLVSSGGADLELRDLTFDGGDEGVYVPVPAAATGTLTVKLHRVALVNNYGHGLHLDDKFADSAASVELIAHKIRVQNNGSIPGPAVIEDRDGIRVDEGGDGDLLASISHSRVIANGGDGIELDETGDGDVVLRAIASKFDDNGFEDPADLDDGFDIDETGDGSVRANVAGSTFNGNRDEGVDFDEEGLGDLIVNLAGVRANGNKDENIKLSEDADAEPPDPEDYDLNDPAGIAEFEADVAAVNDEGGGDLIAHLAFVQANGSEDGDGIRFEEFGFGDLTANLLLVVANGNDDEGIQISEGTDLYDDPDVAAVRDLSALNSGDLRVRVAGSKVKHNGDKGLQVEQFTFGEDVGRLKIRFSDISGNADDDLDTDGVDLV